MNFIGSIINTEFFIAAVRLSVPIILAAVAATICEKAGIINIAMEGMMLIGAFFAAWGAWLTGNPWIGLMFGIFAGTAMGLFHGWATIDLHMNHVVSGAVINILGFGITRYLMVLVFRHPGNSEQIPLSLAAFRFKIPLLNKIPFIGDILFNQTPIVYLTIVLLFVIQWVLKRSAFGLHLHAAGEHPEVLATLGISVKKIRYIAVGFSGTLCGIAGAFLSIENGLSFSEGMTSGRGFIALGANTAGGWSIIGSVIASLFFGAVDALALRIQVLNIFDIYSELFLIFPYVAALIAVGGLVFKSNPPKALGEDYQSE
jgi:simple sugar transport system permease protein